MADHERVRIGNQTSYKAIPPERPFDYALARQFDAFEWFPDRRPSGQGWLTADLDDDRRREIRRRAVDAGVALSVHATLPADPLCAESHEEINRDLRLAEDLGATLLNIHMSQAGPPGRYAEGVAPLVRRCAGARIRLAIENTPADAPGDFNALFARLEEIADWPTGAVGMCLDIGHANLCAETRNDYLGYLDRLGPHVPIVHLHAHENRGDRDSHLPMFSGPAGEDPSGVEGLVIRLKRRGFCGCIVLEQWPDPPALLDRARDGLLRLFRAD
ncbi:MAG: TIM barrel protein [Isosphaeraceae bacterium]|nr:TIM barrel protein [Isosphaeraceae bacterium]